MIDVGFAARYLPDIAKAVFTDLEVRRQIAVTTMRFKKQRLDAGLRSDGGRNPSYSTKRIAIKWHPDARGGKLIHRWWRGKKTDFIVYEGGYAEYREAMGKRSDVIDLQLTGEMIGSLTSRDAGGDTIRVGVWGSPSRRAARWDRRMRWMDISREELEAIEAIIHRATLAAVDRAGDDRIEK